MDEIKIARLIRNVEWGETDEKDYEVLIDLLREFGGYDTAIDLAENDPCGILDEEESEETYPA